MIMKAGGCNIKLKALNAEKAGAHLAIVVAEDDTEADQLINNSNSLSQLSSDIPTLITTKAEISALQSKYLKSKEILMKFQMPLPRHSHVTLDFYVVPNDSRFYSFIRTFEDYASKFEGNLDTHIYLLKAGDENDALLDKMTRMFNCLNSVVFFEIIGSFNEFCVSKALFTPECLQTQIDAVENKYIAEARRCVQKNQPIQYLNEMNMHNNKGYNKRSYVYINGKEFIGSLKADNLFEAVCGGFTHAPEYCVYLNNRYTPNTHYHEIKYNVKRTRLITILANIALAIFLLLVAGISMFLIYEKLYKQMLEVRTHEIVRQSVIDYQSIKNNE